MIKVGKTNYCIPCANRKEKETKDRETLYKTIQALYKLPYPNGQMLRQIKEFKEMRSYTYEGMTKTLCYVKKVLKKELFINGGMALLPYHYDNAIAYYDKLEEQRKNTGEVKSDIVLVKMTPLKHSTDMVRNRAFIKMEDLT
jgi:hypothetical protein